MNQASIQDLKNRIDAANKRSKMSQEENIKLARDAFLSAERVVVFTGAGISAESGIATFRDPETGALWSRFNPDMFSSMSGFLDDPGLVWEWKDALTEKVRKTKPNKGHEAIARMGDLKEVAVVTQNIDDLHERAGSQKVLHLHGDMTVRCTVCDWTEQHHTVDNCPECKALTRPNVVWFGEMLDDGILTEAQRLIIEADLVIVVGTSMRVEPAASLPTFAKRLISINTRPEDHGRLAIQAITLTGKAGEILPQLLND